MELELNTLLCGSNNIKLKESAVSCRYVVVLPVTILGSSYIQV
jgi:hypothetical protein